MKKRKDPNAPKRALSAYMFFCQDKREDVRRKNPDMKFTDIAKELGNQWKGMDEPAKAVYADMAQKDKERYTKEMTAYEANKPGNNKDDSSDEEEKPKKKDRYKEQVHG